MMSTLLRMTFTSGLMVLLVPRLGSADTTKAPLRYLALGDSFTIGTGSLPADSFPSQLRRILKGRGLELRVENVAVNGYSTREVIEEELPVLHTQRPDVVTVAVGANDIVRGDDEVEYRANLKRIFAALTAAEVPTVFVLPQPDWSLSPIAKGFGAPSAIHARIEHYNGILREEAERAKFTYVDLFPLFVRQARAGLIADDGLHPSAKAYREWAEQLADRFAQLRPASRAAP